MRRILAFFALVLLALPALAGDGAIVLEDGFARSSVPGAPIGAAYLVLRNDGDTDDRLIGVVAPSAEMAQIHTHTMDDDGVMRMTEVEGGLALPAGGRIVMERGGDHLMLMGLTEPLEEGGELALTLIFEAAGEVDVTVPVDLTRGQPTR